MPPHPNPSWIRAAQSYKDEARVEQRVSSFRRWYEMCDCGIMCQTVLLILPSSLGRCASRESSATAAARSSTSCERGLFFSGTTASQRWRSPGKTGILTPRLAVALRRGGLDNRLCDETRPPGSGPFCRTLSPTFHRTFGRRSQTRPLKNTSRLTEICGYPSNRPGTPSQRPTQTHRIQGLD